MSKTFVSIKRIFLNTKYELWNTDGFFDVEYKHDYLSFKQRTVVFVIEHLYKYLKKKTRIVHFKTNKSIKLFEP